MIATLAAIAAHSGPATATPVSSGAQHGHGAPAPGTPPAPSAEAAPSAAKQAGPRVSSGVQSALAAIHFGK